MQAQTRVRVVWKLTNFIPRDGDFPFKTELIDITCYRNICFLSFTRSVNSKEHDIGEKFHII